MNILKKNLFFRYHFTLFLVLLLFSIAFPGYAHIHSEKNHIFPTLQVIYYDEEAFTEQNENNIKELILHYREVSEEVRKNISISITPETYCEWEIGLSSAKCNLSGSLLPSTEYKVQVKIQGDDFYSKNNRGKNKNKTDKEKINSDILNENKLNTKYNDKNVFYNRSSQQEKIAESENVGEGIKNYFEPENMEISLPFISSRLQVQTVISSLTDSAERLQPAYIINFNFNVFLKDVKKYFSFLTYDSTKVSKYSAEEVINYYLQNAKLSPEYTEDGYKITAAKAVFNDKRGEPDAIGSGGTFFSLDLANRGKASRSFIIIPAQDLPAKNEVILAMLPGIVPVGGNIADKKGFYTKVFPSVSSKFSLHPLAIKCRYGYADAKGHNGGNDNIDYSKRLNVATADNVNISGLQMYDNSGNPIGYCDPEGIEIFFDGFINMSNPQWKSQYLSNFKQGYVTQKIVYDIKKGGSIYYDSPWERGFFDSILLRNIKGSEKYHLDFSQEAVNDIFGNRLVVDQPIIVRTGMAIPKLFVANRIAFYPLVATNNFGKFFTINVDKLIFNYSLINENKLTNGLIKTVDISGENRNQIIEFNLDFKDIIGEKGGIFYGRLTTDPRVSALDSFDDKKPLIYQISPYAVHAKIAHFDSIVWVVDANSAEPVADANVSIVLVDDFASIVDDFANNIMLTKKDIEKGIEEIWKAQVIVPANRTDRYGIAAVPGAIVLDPQLTRGIYDKSRLMIKVEKNGYTSYLPLSSEFFVRGESIGQKYNRTNSDGSLLAWGITDQIIYQAGEEMKYKVYGRRDLGAGIFIDVEKYRYDLCLVTPEAKNIVISKDIKFNTYGSFSGHYQLPSDLAEGVYHVEMSAYKNDGVRGDNSSPQFVAPVSAIIIDNSFPLPFEVAASIEKDYLLSWEKNKIFFSANKPKEMGRSTYTVEGSITANSSLDTILHLRKENNVPHDIDNFHFSVKADDIGSNYTFYQQKGVMANDGSDMTLISPMNYAQLPYYGIASFAVSIKDNKGNESSDDFSVPYFGRDRFVGISTLQPALVVGESADVSFMVLDARGRRVHDWPIDIIVEQEVDHFMRLKTSAGIFKQVNVTDFVPVVEKKLLTINGLAVLKINLEKVGSYRFTAKIKDSYGKEHISVVRKIAQPFPVNFVVDDHSGDAVISADKESYVVGDIAHYTVDNLHPGDLLLITVEEKAVNNVVVKKVTGTKEKFDIEVRDIHFPQSYVSVVVLSQNNADLNKQSSQTLYKELQVTRSLKDNVFVVGTKKEYYQPGEEVRASLYLPQKSTWISRNHELSKKEIVLNKNRPIDVGIIVVSDQFMKRLGLNVDEYFDVYQAFYGHHKYIGVENYNIFNDFQKLDGKPILRVDNTAGVYGLPLLKGYKNNWQKIFPSLKKHYSAYWNPDIVMKNDEYNFTFTAPNKPGKWHIIAIAENGLRAIDSFRGEFMVNGDVKGKPGNGE